MKYAQNLVILMLLALVAGCGKQDEAGTQEPLQKKMPHATSAHANGNEHAKCITFDVENKTGKTMYVTCFSYIKRRDFGHWRWEKSPIIKIDNDRLGRIATAEIDDRYIRDNVFGYLGVFDNQQEAEDSIYELLPDSKKIDLDRLVNLAGKKVTLNVEKYGFKGEYYEFDFIDAQRKKKIKRTPNLDFPVENRTGKTALVVCFVYEKKAKGTWFAAVDDKDDMEVWHFRKSPVIRIAPNAIGIVPIDKLTEERDRSYARGHLAVFDEDEEKLAEQSTYELIRAQRKLNLGELSRLQGRKVVLDIEQYGFEEDILDFVVKPTRRIDFTNIHM